MLRDVAFSYLENNISESNAIALFDAFPDYLRAQADTDAARYGMSYDRAAVSSPEKSGEMAPTF